MGASQYGTPALDIEDMLKRIAASKLGVPVEQLYTAFHSFAARGTTPGTPLNGTGGTFAYVSGGLRFSSGGAAGGVAAWRMSATDTAAAHAQFIESGTGPKWLIAARFAQNSTGTTAGCIAGAGCATAGAVEVLMGAHGGASATKFAARTGAGANIISTLDLDTVRRTHMCWRDGVTGYYQIDDRAPDSGDLRPAANASLYVATTDSAATLRTVDIDWIFGARVRP